MNLEMPVATIVFPAKAGTHGTAYTNFSGFTKNDTMVRRNDGPRLPPGRREIDGREVP
jgi:hypothetical protein